MQEKILHQANWAQTSLGTPIELYQKIHTQGAPLVLVGGVHGDEPEGVVLAKELLRWLHSPQAADVVHNWILIPCLNPDGHSKNQRGNSRGVDLNRNFPSSDWSPQAKAPRYFPGESPNSELETQALVQLLTQVKPQLIVHFHSWEPCVVYTGLPGKKAAELIGLGTTYPVHEDIGYPTPGSLGQYGWLELKTPVVCVETQERAPQETLWPIFERGLKKLFFSRDLFL